MKKLISLFFLTGFFALSASDGSLDTAGFGAPNGFVTTPGGSGQAVAVQTDGNIVVVGPDATFTAAQIIRYTTTGALDTSFNGTGIVTQADFFPQDVIVQADGKILVAGGDAALFQNFVLIRYLPTGALDTSFGIGGIVTLPDGPINSVVLQADSKILAIGNGTNGSYVIRLSTSGSVETTFVQVPTGSSLIGGVIQIDGKIIVASTESGLAFLARYNPDGTLDGTYGVGGIATVPAPGAAFISGLVLQTDEKTVVAYFDGTNIVFARFDQQFGVLDPAYGVGGVFVDGAVGIVNFNHLVMQADNKIIFVARDFLTINFLSGRITDSGTTDTSWGTLGFTVAPPGVGFAAGIQADGYVIGAGIDNTFSNTLVTRYINSVPMAPTTIDPVINPVLPGPVTFSGTAQVPSMVYILLDGVLVEAGTQTDLSGNWSITVPLVAAGSHTAQAVSIYQNRKLDIASEIIQFGQDLNTNLVIQKTDNLNGAAAKIGQTINYTVTITNTGSATAQNVLFADTLPNCVEFLAASVSTGALITESGGIITSDLGSIAAGDTITVSISVRVGVTFAPFLINRAVITSSNAPEASALVSTPVAQLQVSCITQAIINKYCPCL